MQISYKGYCALGGASNPRLFSRNYYGNMRYYYV